MYLTRLTVAAALLAAPCFAYRLPPAAADGVPLGGVTMQKFEILPDGRWGNSTLSGAYDEPEPAMPGCGLGLRVGGADIPLTSAGGFDVVYDAWYPRAILTFSNDDLPIEVAYEALSPVIPLDYESSCLPLALFRVRLSSKAEESLPVGVVLTWSQPIEHALGAKVPPGWFSAVESTQGGGSELVASGTLMPRETIELTLGLAWYSRWQGGPYYTKLYESAQAILDHGLAEGARLHRSVLAWQTGIINSNLPSWLSDMLVNDNYVLSSSAFWMADGRFTINEATTTYDLFGTLDQRAYGSLGYLVFFPELDWSELDRWALLAEPDGGLHHDFVPYEMNEGRGGIGGGARTWTDLSPKFVCNVARNYLWTGDERRLRALWPACVAAMEHQRAFDADGDALPDSTPTYDERCERNITNTYDYWSMYGDTAYGADWTLCAIACMELMAGRLGLAEDAAAYAEWRAAAMGSAEADLWTGTYYRLYNDTGAPDDQHDHPLVSDIVFEGQLAGQWYADFLRLGHLHPRSRVASSVDVMARLLRGESLVYNGRNPDGTRPDYCGDHRACGEGWPGYTRGHFTSLAITRGRGDVGLDGLRRVYRNIYVDKPSAFDQPLRIFEDDFGNKGHYMTSPAVWHVLAAVLGLHWDLPAGELALMPRPPGWLGDRLWHVAVPGASAWGVLEDYYEWGAGLELRLYFDRPVELRRLRLRDPNAGNSLVRVTVAGADPAHTVRPERGPLDDELVIVFDEPQRVGPEGLRVVVGRARR